MRSLNNFYIRPLFLTDCGSGNGIDAFAGRCFGKVAPSCSAWAIEPALPTSEYEEVVEECAREAAC